MANIQGQKKWSEVRLLETHELARGGVNGNLNEQAKALADRTEFLNQEKASKSEIVQGVFEFGTFAEFNAAKTSLPANCTVVIGEENKTGTGTWGIGNNRWNGSILTKSSFDPVEKSKKYAEELNYKKIEGIIGKNIFNPNAVDVAIGYFPNNATGNLQANASFNTTGYIRVDGGESYALSAKHYLAWYDENKLFISGSPSADTSRVLVAPSNAKFIRASASTAVWPSFQIEKGTENTAFEPYTLSIPSESIGRESITNKQIARRAIPIEKVNFLQIGKNIFSKTAATIGSFIGHDGTIGTRDFLCVSAFIPITPGQKYTGQSSATSFYGMRFVCFYDVDKNVISGGINDGTMFTTTFTAPVNAAYARITINVSSLEIFQLESGETATEYEAYQATLVGQSGEKIVVPFSASSVGTNELSDKSVTPSKTNFLHQSKNLFNKSTATLGKYISGTTGTLTDNATYDTSDYIPVSPGMQYTSNKTMRFHAFFSASMVFMAGGSNNAGTNFSVPDGAAFVRITLSHSDLSSFQIEAGSVSTSFEAHGYTLKLPDGTPIATDTSSASRWKGKKWATLGDSITAGAHWQGFVVGVHQLSWTNFGVSGTKISGAVGDTNAMCQDNRINAIPVDTDLVTMMGGTNDWAQNVPIGTIDSTDPLTFYGALNTFAIKAFARWPTKRIAVATTPYGEIPAYESRPGWTSPAKNSLGLTTNDYAEAIRQFCKRANLHCIDVAESGGWGTYNIVPYLGGSTTDNLHPASDSDAAKGIGIVHIKALKDIEPLQ